MTITDTLAALRPLVSQHTTAQGKRVGFFMADAARALGGLAQASNALMVLLAEGLVNSEPVLIDNDVHALYSLADVTPPVVH